MEFYNLCGIIGNGEGFADEYDRDVGRNSKSIITSGDDLKNSKVEMKHVILLSHNAPHTSCVSFLFVSQRRATIPTEQIMF